MTDAKFEATKNVLVVTAPARGPKEPDPRQLRVVFRRHGTPSYTTDGRRLALELIRRLPSATLYEVCLTLDEMLSEETRAGVSFGKLLGERPADATWDEIDDADQGGKRIERNQYNLPL